MQIPRALTGALERTPSLLRNLVAEPASKKCELLFGAFASQKGFPQKVSSDPPFCNASINKHRKKAKSLNSPVLENGAKEPLMGRESSESQGVAKGACEHRCTSVSIKYPGELKESSIYKSFAAPMVLRSRTGLGSLASP